MSSHSTRSFLTNARLRKAQASRNMFDCRYRIIVKGPVYEVRSHLSHPQELEFEMDARFMRVCLWKVSGCLRCPSSSPPAGTCNPIPPALRARQRCTSLRPSTPLHQPLHHPPTTMASTNSSERPPEVQNVREYPELGRTVRPYVPAKSLNTDYPVCTSAQVVRARC